MNQYAAMPSLHVGWDLLVGISIVTAAATVLVRAIGWVLPALMAFAVVATANHYVVDVAAGIALAMVGFAGPCSSSSDGPVALGRVLGPVQPPRAALGSQS